jgi:ribonucleoside-diphosphate reductase beta chain
MNFAFSVIEDIRKEEPELFDADLQLSIREMLQDAVETEMIFARDLLEGGIAGLSGNDMYTYLKFVADQRLMNLQMKPMYGVSNPFPFMEQQDVQELTNFFERRVSAYQVGISGEVAFDEAF